MKIHYQNGKGEEKIISDVLYIQNCENGELSALLKNGKEVSLRVDRVEAILSNSLIEKER